MAHFLSLFQRIFAEPVHCVSSGCQPCHRYTSIRLSSRNKAGEATARVLDKSTYWTCLSNSTLRLYRIANIVHVTASDRVWVRDYMHLSVSVICVPECENASLQSTKDVWGVTLEGKASRHCGSGISSLTSKLTKKCIFLINTPQLLLNKTQFCLSVPGKNI